MRCVTHRCVPEASLRRSARPPRPLSAPLRGYGPAGYGGSSAAGWHPSRRSRNRLGRTLLALVLLAVVAAAVQWFRPLPSARLVSRVTSELVSAGTAVSPPWPSGGEAALAVAGLGMLGGDRADRAVPIASIAKVMTAYVILTDHPLSPGASGPLLTVSPADVLTYRQDVATAQSVVAVTAGEQLTERQALQALLIPSANNIAQLLAAWDAGSVTAFVAKMNAVAARLGMSHTHYTDPSGLAASTVSSASDQLRLATVAMRLPEFAAIVAQPQVTLPVAGTVYNYDYEVGHDGFIGIKTGSDGAAGGCWLFAAHRLIVGRERVVYGIVLGQHGAGGQLIQPALDAGKVLADAAPRLVEMERLISAGTSVGYWSAPWGADIPLRTATPLAGLVLPGQHLQVIVRFARRLPARIAAGQVVGQLRIVGGFSAGSRWQTAVVISRSAPPPGWKWRLTRLS